MYMKYLSKLSVRIIIAVIVGFLFAGAFTNIAYSCPPIESAEGCTSFESAIMNPGDLLSNEQGSLVQFSTTLIVVSLVTIAVLSVPVLMQRKTT